MQHQLVLVHFSTLQAPKASEVLIDFVGAIEVVEEIDSVEEIYFAEEKDFVEEIDSVGVFGFAQDLGQLWAPHK